MCCANKYWHNKRQKKKAGHCTVFTLEEEISKHLLCLFSQDYKFLCRKTSLGSLKLFFKV